ncbi:MAG: hypothetical protein CL521_02205 [Actinobacteria bacterium]|nr:hypothetical protein [Actinomycetota bacterium]
MISKQSLLYTFLQIMRCFFTCIFKLLLFAMPLLALDMPSFISIQHKDGILIRESVSQSSDPIGTAHYLYAYPVVDAKVTYVKVMLPDNKIGWVYVAGKTTPFKIQGQSFTSVAAYDIPVKHAQAPYDVLGVIKPQQKVPIIDRWYGRLKIRTPDQKEGWIFNGPYHSAWTSYIRNADYHHHYFADFSSPSVISNMSISSTLASYFQPQSCLRLMMPNESEVSVTFSLPKVPRRAILLLNHLAASLEDGTSYSPVSIKVNGQLVASELSPSGRTYHTDILHISKWLNTGDNTIELSLSDAKTHYFIKSISMRVQYD